MTYHDKKFGFTLSELLITLGIIGVVAALTMPTLIAKHQEKTLINQLKTAYTVLNQAFKQAANDYGEVDTWGADSTERTYNAPNILSKYIKVIKSCPKNNGKCVAGYHYSRPSNNGTIAAVHGQGPSVVLANGMNVVFREWGTLQVCDKTVQEFSSLVADRKEKAEALCFSIYVDINGVNKPNFASKDLFEFYVLKDGIVPAGSAGTDTWIWTTSFKDNCKNTGSAYGPMSQLNCTAWVLAHENMDYLYCPDKISWDGPFSCKEAE